MRLPAGTIKRLHVDQGIIAKCRREGLDLPAITVQTSKGSIKARAVKVLGPSKFIQRFEKPLSCGARLWIETKAALEITR